MHIIDELETILMEEKKRHLMKCAQHARTIKTFQDNLDNNLGGFVIPKQWIRTSAFVKADPNRKTIFDVYCDSGEEKKLTISTSKNENIESECIEDWG